MTLTALSAITLYNNITDEFSVGIIESRNESVESFSEYYDPTDLRQRIDRANRVFVHADYDADGVMSAAIARLYLPNAEIYTPERADGYGVSADFVGQLGAGDLLITADCGIRSRQELSTAAAGVDVIVTDHHVPQQSLLPECTVINTLLYPHAFHGYSGASVIMLVLESIYGPVPSAMQYAAIGAICDVMPMRGPNRRIVRDGVASMSSRANAPIAALCKASKVYAGAITPEDIGWKLGPAINAAGRMGDAQSSIDLFCGTYGFDILVQRLVQYNQERKRAVSDIVSGITPDNTLIDTDYVSAVLLKDVPAGFVGLVASSIAKNTRKTSLVMTGGSLLSGSLRAYGDANCIELLNRCSKYLEKYGGHSGAAGFSVKRENLSGMMGALASLSLREESHSPESKPDWRVPIELSIDEAEGFAYDLEDYEPYGSSFERPRFVDRSEIHTLKSMGSDKSHSSFIAGNTKCVMFGQDSRWLVPGKEYEVTYTPKVNRFLGKESVQLEVYKLKELE